jgi:hypothetical protein
MVAQGVVLRRAGMTALAEKFDTDRRAVLGDTARDDHETTDLLAALRSDANWSYLASTCAARRQRFLQRPGTCLDIATFRTLALLATHSAQFTRVRDALAGRDPSHPHDLPYLRACVLESVRLWPTALVVLRDSTTDTTWNGQVLPAQVTVVILSSFFHRDEQTLPFADHFTPEIWLDGQARDNPALIPFSDCRARSITSVSVSRSRRKPELDSHRPGAGTP